MDIYIYAYIYTYYICSTLDPSKMAELLQYVSIPQNRFAPRKPVISLAGTTSGKFSETWQVKGQGGEATSRSNMFGERERLDLLTSMHVCIYIYT